MFYGKIKISLRAIFAVVLIGIFSPVSAENFSVNYTKPQGNNGDRVYRSLGDKLEYKIDVRDGDAFTAERCIFTFRIYRGDYYCAAGSNLFDSYYDIDPVMFVPENTYTLKVQTLFHSIWTGANREASDTREVYINPVKGNISAINYNNSNGKIFEHLLVQRSDNYYKMSGRAFYSGNMFLTEFYDKATGKYIAGDIMKDPATDGYFYDRQVKFPQQPGNYNAKILAANMGKDGKHRYHVYNRTLSLMVVDQLPSLRIGTDNLASEIHIKKESMTLPVEIQNYQSGLDEYIDKMTVSVDGFPAKTKVIPSPTSKTFTATVDTSGIWQSGQTRTLRICMDLGNNRTTCDYHVVKYKNIKPEISWSGEYKNDQTLYTNKADVRLTLAAKEYSAGEINSGQLFYRAKDGKWQYMPLQGSGTQWSATPRLNPGVLYEFQAQITNVDGVKSDWTASTYVGFDNTPPTVSWSGDNYANQTRWVNNSRVTVSVNGYDNFAGIKGGKLRYSPYNNGNFQPWKEVHLSGAGNHWQAELVLEPVGRAYEIQAQVEDVAGNLSPWTEHQQATFIELDNGAPTVAWAGDIKPGKTYWLTHAEASLAMTATDAASGVAKGSLSWTSDNGVSWQYKAAKQNGNQWSEKVTLSPGLTYRFTLNATDKAGNASKWLPESRVIYKKDKPVISWDKDQPLALVDSHIEVKGRVTDSQQDKLLTVIQWQEVGATSWQSSQPVTLDDNGFFTATLRGLDLNKSWVLHINSSDVAGNLVSSDNKYLTALFKDADLSLSQCDDLDQSNGCTPGDTLRLKLSVTAASDVKGMMAQVTLPTGLSSTGRPLLDAENTDLHPDNASKVSTSLNLQWTGSGSQTDLFSGKEGTPVLEKGERFTLLLPVKIDEQAQGTQTSQALLGSSADLLGQLKREVALKLQTDNFPPAQALHLEIASPEVNNGETVISTQAFNYCLSLRAGKWGLSGSQLQYMLPGGLRATDAPSISHKSDISQGINKSWNGADNQQLLDTNVMLKPNQRLLLRIPVQLTNAGTKLSSVKASARSVNGEKTVTHCLFGESLDYMSRPSCISTLPSVVFAEKDMDCR